MTIKNKRKKKNKRKGLYNTITEDSLRKMMEDLYTNAPRPSNQREFVMYTNQAGYDAFNKAMQEQATKIFKTK